MPVAQPDPSPVRRGLEDFQQVAIAGVVGQVEAVLFDGDVRQLLFTATALELLVFGPDGGFKLAVFVVGKFQEDQAQNRGLIIPAWILIKPSVQPPSSSPR